MTVGLASSVVWDTTRRNSVAAQTEAGLRDGGTATLDERQHAIHTRYGELLSCSGGPADHKFRRLRIAEAEVQAQVRCGGEPRLPQHTLHLFPPGKLTGDRRSDGRAIRFGPRQPHL